MANLEEYDGIVELIGEAGVIPAVAENFLDKVTTAAVIEELKRLLATAQAGDDTMVTLFSRIIELEATL